MIAHSEEENMEKAKQVDNTSGNNISASDVDDLLDDLEVDPEDEVELSAIEDFDDEAEVVEDADADEPGGVVAQEDEIDEMDLEQAARDIEAHAEEIDENPLPSIEEADEEAEKNRAAAKTKVKRASTPRASRDLTALPDAVFQRYATSTAADDKTETLTNKPKQIKVVEKLDNLFFSLHAGTTPQRYTADAFRFLCDRGTITTGDLVKFYMTLSSSNKNNDTVAESTARSQTGQMFSLFPHLGIAKNTAKSTITVDKDSLITQKLAKQLGITL